ncbi:MAG: phosphoribosylamine--glycine ligase [Spirulinaceae cyanobacterium RM2_2_10]|nr:phosphoribosylamine--glycine ligase [Spirulinaceae cyanobacterium SM2_1_0]NJO19469.1 phosphoribosylamine--glycine ligase [Spirulinaceae cyanobacterium RM2_2_10]
MKVLVVGSGGREHAIARHLLQSPEVTQVFCIPGNGGTATLPRCRNFAMSVDDFEGIGCLASVQGVSLVVIGPEQPLAAGITDYLRQQNLTVFGPTQAGAQLEASKSWAKTLMLAADIPTAKSATFTTVAAARAYIAAQGAPIVVKADGLAAGKGAIVAPTLETAIAAAETLWEQGHKTLVVEEYLEGEELSVFALTDGKSTRLLLPAQDHKRIGEGDIGDNTGGMGAYAPAPLGTPALLARVEQEIIQPTVQALAGRRIDYRGVIYAGLMVTPSGDPKVLEFNCRFGDPEAQAVLPLLETPLHTVLLACACQTLDQLPPLTWQPGFAACVVAASPGYPGDYPKGAPITGLAEAETDTSFVYQAGTQLKQQQLLTSGGRVLGVTGLGDTLTVAVERAYDAIQKIDFTGIYYRRDIAWRALSTARGDGQTDTG